MFIIGILGFIVLVYAVGFLSTWLYILTLPPFEQSLMTLKHRMLTCILWVIAIPLMSLANRGTMNSKYNLWFAFIFLSGLCCWISKVFCSIFACFLLESFWGIPVGWVGLNVLYWLFLVFVSKDDCLHMASSFQESVNAMRMGIRLYYFPIPNNSAWQGKQRDN